MLRELEGVPHVATQVISYPPRGVSDDPERVMVFEVMKMNLGLLIDEPLRY